MLKPEFPIFFSKNTSLPGIFKFLAVKQGIMVYFLLVLSLQPCYDIFIVLLYYMINVVKHSSQTTLYDYFNNALYDS